MKLYGLKTCETCRKALKSLPEAEFVDVRGTGVPAAVLRLAIEQFGPRIVNQRSATWRQMDAKSRDLPLDELIQRHPTVMKRPLIQAGSRLCLGWDKAVQTALGA